MYCCPQGPNTAHLRTLAPTTIPGMLLEPESLNGLYLNPFGLSPFVRKPPSSAGSLSSRLDAVMTVIVDIQKLEALRCLSIYLSICLSIYR